MTDLYWDSDDGQEGLLTRRSSEHCLNEQEIEDYLFNRLSGVSREAVEEHLLMCPDCVKRVEEEEQYVDSIRSAAGRIESETLMGSNPAEPEPGQQPKAGSRSWYALAAGLAVLLIGGTVAVRFSAPRTAAEVELRVERSGQTSDGSAPAAQQRLLLKPDLRGLPPLPSLRWTVVDRKGVLQAEGRLVSNGDTGEIRLDRGLPEGLYWVRIIDPESGVLLREYGLEVRGRR